MEFSGVWTASNSVSSATCSWRQEALNPRLTENFKITLSKWRILRSVFNCTRIWRDVGRQAQHLQVGYTLDLQFRSMEVNQDLASSKPSATDSTLPTNESSATVRDSLEDTKQSDKLSHGCKKPCISQDLMFFGHVPKPCMFPQVIITQPNYAQPILGVEAFVVVIISLDYNQYATDHVDWGGWGTSYVFKMLLKSNNACVSIATLFQAASILLFQAAYFWLKFREALSSGRKRKLSGLYDVGCTEDVHHSLRGGHPCKRKSSETQVLQCRDMSDLELGVYTRGVRDKSGIITHYKYEPRFKPPRERMDSGVTLKFNCLSLGQYNTPAEAKIVRQIAAFYYGKDEDKVELEDGSQFSIPPMSGQERDLSGEKKKKWVTWKAKKVYAELRKEKVQKSKHLRKGTMIAAHPGLRTDAGSDLSPSASTVIYSSPASSAHELALSQDHTPSSAIVHTVEPIPASGLILGIYSGNCHGVQYNVPEMENDAPTSDDHVNTPRYTDDYIETVSSFDLDMINELLSGPASIPPHQPSFLDNQMHHFGTTDSPRDPTPPQCDGYIAQGYESIEHELRPNLISFHQGWDLVKSSLIFRQKDPMLLQLVDHQKKQLEDAAVQNTDLQHRLGRSEIQNLELQQEIQRLEAMLQQVAMISNCTRIWNHI